MNSDMEKQAVAKKAILKALSDLETAIQDFIEVDERDINDNDSRSVYEIIENQLSYISIDEDMIK